MSHGPCPGFAQSLLAKGIAYEMNWLSGDPPTPSDRGLAGLSTGNHARIAPFRRYSARGSKDEFGRFHSFFVVKNKPRPPL
jgi:hypothetical protein